MSSASAAASTAEAVAAALTASDRFLVQQTFRPLLNEYRISVPAPGSAVEGEPLLFVRQKRLKVKEDIRFRLAEDDGPHLFAIASKTVFEFRGRHEVLDASGAVIGTLEKRFGRSLLRSHWRVRDAAGTEVLEALEASRLIALVRRVLDLVPEVVGLQQLLPFHFVLRRGEDEAGSYRRVLWRLRDRYVLDLRTTPADVDRRLVLALAVALDALQDR